MGLYFVFFHFDTVGVTSSNLVSPTTFIQAIGFRIDGFFVYKRQAEQSRRLPVPLSENIRIQTLIKLSQTLHPSYRY